MKFTKFSKYTGEPADGVDLQELVKRLGYFFLQSGFEAQYYGISEFDRDRSMEALREAILNALQEVDLLSSDKISEELRKLLNRSDAANNKEIQDLLDKLMDRLANEGFINPQQPQITPPNRMSARGALGDPRERKTEARFEITDKTIDFLGFKTLRDLLGSLGRSSFGRHDTRDLATGVESGGASRAYEFGDTLNLDVSETLFNAVRRDGAQVPIEIGYQDLMVHQANTNLLTFGRHADCCWHGLYGEDRFTPAKRVAMALSHLIRTQFQAIHCIWFSSTTVPKFTRRTRPRTSRPLHTNTRGSHGQRILLRQRKDMRQIFMITDGKPSALTLEDGRIYKNAFGLDPFVVSETLEEVSKCKRANIMINTFMLATDYSLVNFVQKITQMCRGKAYFTTPQNLGQYLLMDFMQRKTRHIH
jgi:Ca-activated chloride channel family protein